MAMTTAQTRSDFDEPNTSVLSTSSHTHVDYPDADQQSASNKMSVLPSKFAADALIPVEAAPAEPQIPVAAHVQDPNTTQGVPSAAAPPTTPHKPPPPACLQSCITSIESCTANIVRFNERLEHSRTSAAAQREETGDPIVARKAIIPLVFIILSWVFLAFVWRLCSRLIEKNPQGRVLGTRAEGIGLLVGFVILWLMTMWSYVTVISKGPGLVKDYVRQSDPPMQAGQPWQGHGPAGPMPIPAQAGGGSRSDLPARHAEDGPASPAPATSLPYPSFNADLEAFGGNRASSDSMRVLPGSHEPEHHIEPIGSNMVAEEAISPAKTAAKVVSQPPAPVDEAEAAAGDPQLPGIIGPLASAVAGAQGAAEASNAPLPPPPISQRPQQHSGWAPPERRPQNDPPPLSPSALYCHRCRHVKPPRSHHCRRCGTCVLKMDHHCPWVGGCVGAHNQRFFFIFVCWVTLLELYTLISTAVFFHRGIQSLNQPGSAWKVDGFLISLFPICAIFLIFTGALLGTHLFLMGRNMTTIEHVGINRVQGKERVLVDRWFGMQQSQNKKGTSWGGMLKAKRKMVREWDREWGSLTREGNRWWLGSSLEADWTGGRGSEKHASAQEGKGKRKGAWKTNMSQALGSNLLLWVVPVGKHPNEGLEFPMNPRFGPEGVQRRRGDWPSELR